MYCLLLLYCSLKQLREFEINCEFYAVSLEDRCLSSYTEVEVGIQLEKEVQN